MFKYCKKQCFHVLTDSPNTLSMSLAPLIARMPHKHCHPPPAHGLLKEAPCPDIQTGRWRLEAGGSCCGPRHGAERPVETLGLSARASSFFGSMSGGEGLSHYTDMHEELGTTVMRSGLTLTLS